MSHASLVICDVARLCVCGCRLPDEACHRIIDAPPAAAVKALQLANRYIAELARQTPARQVRDYSAFLMKQLQNTCRTHDTMPDELLRRIDDEVAFPQPPCPRQPEARRRASSTDRSIKAPSMAPRHGRHAGKQSTQSNHEAGQGPSSAHAQSALPSVREIEPPLQIETVYADTEQVPHGQRQGSGEVQHAPMLQLAPELQSLVHSIVHDSQGEVALHDFDIGVCKLLTDKPTDEAQSNLQTLLAMAPCLSGAELLAEIEQL